MRGPVERLISSLDLTPSIKHFDACDREQWRARAHHRLEHDQLLKLTVGYSLAPAPSFSWCAGYTGTYEGAGHTGARSEGYRSHHPRYGRASDPQKTGGKATK